MKKKIYEIDSSNGISAKIAYDIYEGRKNIIKSLPKLKKFESDVTILVQAYNRLDKTKECISSILKYTSDVNFDLLLIDNGSTDETFEYFKSIDYDKVTILHINKNISALYPVFFYDPTFLSKYFVTLGNDIIVTSNWLSNLIKVAESDDKIGIVNPMSSNVSNLQDPNLIFDNIDDMQEKAAILNVSDPTKWHERLRIITLGTLYKKECLYAIGWPINDIGFFHDFSDDDISFRVRRAGYKVILAKDTWIHHNHQVFNLENKSPEQFQKSLEVGRKNFKDKYFGIDAWDDVNNFVYPFIGENITMPSNETPKILGIDVKCGTPILDIKNSLLEYGLDGFETYAFTGDAKYYTDLCTVCNMCVVCDRIDYLYNSFKSSSFDFIIIGKDINEYSQPERVIRDAYALLRNGGQMFVSLKNTFNVFTLLELLGHNVAYSEKSVHSNIDVFCRNIKNMGISVDVINYETYQSNDVIRNFANQIVEIAKAEDVSENIVKQKLMINKYWLKIVK